MLIILLVSLLLQVQVPSVNVTDSQTITPAAGTPSALSDTKQRALTTAAPLVSASRSHAVPNATKPNSLTGDGPDKTNTATEKLDVWSMLLIIISCGLLGGGWNFMRSQDPLLQKPDVKPPADEAQGINANGPAQKVVDPIARHRDTCLLGGVIAAGIVPFLLQSASSKILEEPSTYNYFVFAAYCLAAAVSSVAFIDSASTSISKRFDLKLQQLTDQTLTTEVKALQNSARIQDLQHVTQTLYTIQRNSLPSGNDEVDKQSLNFAKETLQGLSKQMNTSVDGN